MNKLKKTLRDNLNLKAKVDKEEIFKIELEIKGIGITFSSENGGTVGIGVGFAGIEIDKEGGGSVSMFDDFLKMDVEVNGCTQVKKDYIGGQLVRIEIVKVPGCDERKKEGEVEDWDADTENSDAREIEEPDTLDVPFYPGDEDDELLCTFNYLWGKGISDWSSQGFDGKNVFNRGGSGASTISVDGAGLIGYEGVQSSSIYKEYADGQDPTFSQETNPIEKYWTNLTVKGLATSYAPEYYFHVTDIRPGADKDILSEKDHQSIFTEGIDYKPVALFRWQLHYLLGILNHSDSYSTYSYSSFQFSSVGVASMVVLKYARGEFPDVTLNDNGVNIDKDGRYRRDESMSTRCCFTENDRKLLISSVIALNSLGFPGHVKKGSSSVDWFFPTNKTKFSKDEILIPNYLALTQFLSEQNTSTEKIEKFLGIDAGLNVQGSEKYLTGSKETGFPLQVPDYLRQPKDKKGKLIKDPTKFPKKKINNYRELVLYQWEVISYLARFTNSVETVKNGWTIPSFLMSPTTDESSTQTVDNLTEITAALANIIHFHGLHSLGFDAKVPGTGENVPVTPISPQDFIKSCGDLLAEIKQQSVRNQNSLIRLSLSMEDLRKPIITGFRITKFLLNAIGIPYREVANKEEAIAINNNPNDDLTVDPEDLEIDTRFNVAEAQKAETLDERQNNLNKPGKMPIKKFFLKPKTLTLWLKLFSRKR